MKSGCCSKPNRNFTAVSGTEVKKDGRTYAAGIRTAITLSVNSEEFNWVAPVKKTRKERGMDQCQGFCDARHARTDGKSLLAEAGAAGEKAHTKHLASCIW